MYATRDYHFELPDELIAQAPCAERDRARLLRVGPPHTDSVFADLASALPAEAVLVVNNTKVMAARLYGRKATGGATELLCLEPSPVAAPAGMSAWRCLAKASLRVGQPIALTTADGSAAEAVVLSERETDATLVVALPGDGYGFLRDHGELPLPHYIQRPGGQAADDRARYQTVFAEVEGAVAAPTAGLHMTPQVMASLAARGITLTSLTLHVGWGTFAPVRTDDIRAHQMHRERYDIPEATAALIASGRPVVALGTTAMRALEAAALGPKSVRVGAGATSLFIYPGSGHRFQIVDALVTNFHLPESTLLMLVSAFAGAARVREAYAHAVAQRYRFFSYGDAMLLTRAEELP